MRAREFVKRMNFFLNDISQYTIVKKGFIEEKDKTIKRLYDEADMHRRIHHRKNKAKIVQAIPSFNTLNEIDSESLKKLEKISWMIVRHYGIDVLGIKNEADLQRKKYKALFYNYIKYLQKVSKQNYSDIDSE